MKFTDLEVGDRVKLISLSGFEIMEGCTCSYCKFRNKNVGKELEIVKIIGCTETTVSLTLQDENGVREVFNVKNSSALNNFKITFVKED